MVETNYIALKPGVPERLHFTNYAWADTVQHDPLLKLDLTKKKLVFVVDRQGTVEVSKTYSTMRSKEWAFWEPFLADGSYKNYIWELTYSKNDFASEVKIVAIPS
jgi:hypothetical protein